MNEPTSEDAPVAGPHAGAELEDVETAVPQEELTEHAPAAEHLTLRDLRKVKLPVTAELGTCHLLVREVLDLKRGSVLALNKMAGEMADLMVNGVPFARGEVVVLGDTLHVRIAEVFGMEEEEGG